MPTEMGAHGGETTADGALRGTHQCKREASRGIRVDLQSKMSSTPCLTIILVDEDTPPVAVHPNTPILVAFPIAMMKYSNRSNVKERGLHLDQGI